MRTSVSYSSTITGFLDGGPTYRDRKNTNPAVTYAGDSTRRFLRFAAGLGAKARRSSSNTGACRTSSWVTARAVFGVVHIRAVISHCALTVYVPGWLRAPDYKIAYGSD